MPVHNRRFISDKSVSAFRNTTSSCTHRPSSYKHFNKMAIRVSITRVICFRRRKNASSTICRKTPPALGSPHLRRAKTTSVPTALEAVKGISCLTAALRPVFSGKGGGMSVGFFAVCCTRASRKLLKFLLRDVSFSILNFFHGFLTISPSVRLVSSFSSSIVYGQPHNFVVQFLSSKCEEIQ
jgi:hypothetical protein